MLSRSFVSRNVAEGGGKHSEGGAIFLTSSLAEIADCEVVENVARGGAEFTSAGTGVRNAAHDPRKNSCFLSGRLVVLGSVAFF